MATASLLIALDVQEYRWEVIESNVVACIAPQGRIFAYTAQRAITYIRAVCDYTVIGIRLSNHTCIFIDVRDFSVLAELEAPYAVGSKFDADYGPDGEIRLWQIDATESKELTMRSHGTSGSREATEDINVAFFALADRNRRLVISNRTLFTRMTLWSDECVIWTLELDWHPCKMTLSDGIIYLYRNRPESYACVLYDLTTAIKISEIDVPNDTFVVGIQRKVVVCRNILSIYSENGDIEGLCRMNDYGQLFNGARNAKTLCLCYASDKPLTRSRKRQNEHTFTYVHFDVV